MDKNKLEVETVSISILEWRGLNNLLLNREVEWIKCRLEGPNNPLNNNNNNNRGEMDMLSVSLI